MHLLKTLPQRLDPGATPTFAGLIAPSLTSPASTNLTLGLGTGGTALTLASSTLAATFAGVVVVPDGSAAAPSLVVSSSPTTGFYRHGSGAIGFSSAGLACAAFSSNTGGGGLYLEALGTNQNIRLVPSGTGILTTAAPVTFTNTTAGASNVGALVVAGGLATGAASYIGGTLTVSTGRINGTANGVGIMGAATSDTALTVYGTTNDSTKFALVAKDSGSNNLFLVRNDGAATFAGAVSITGNVGFYGQAATAKPTSVAVTAAAIHAALVTLNLIAA